MISTIIIFGFIVIAAISVVRPQFGAWFIWLLPWLYPNTLLYGTLGRFNVRFDDLWLVYMAVFCFILYRTRAKVGTLFLLAVLWTLSQTAGNLTGVVMNRGIGWIVVTKNIFKTLYVPMTTYILLAMLSERQRLEGHLKAMTVAAVLAGALGVVMVYFPGPFSMFLIPAKQFALSALEQVTEGEVGARRSGGAVGGVALAAITMNMAFLSLCMMLYYSKKLSKLFYMCAFGACAIGLGYTVTRGAIGAFLGAMIWAILFSKKRKWLIVITIFGLLGMIWQGDIVGRLISRLVGSIYSSSFATGLENRMRIWDIFIENFKVIYVLVGMGMTTTLNMAHATVHNTYIGAFVYSGIGGVVLMVVLVVRAIKLGRVLVRQEDGLCQALGMYLIMLTLAMLIYGIVAEVFQGYLTMQLFFAALVFGEKRLEQWQEEQEGALEEYSYLENYELAATG